MPSAPKNKNQVKWIEYTLTDEQAAHMKGELKDWKAVAPLLEEMVGEEYKFSLVWDGFNQCFACYITPGPDDIQNKGAVLTGRGKSVFSALRGAIYRHLYVFQKIWQETARRPIDE